VNCAPGPPMKPAERPRSFAVRAGEGRPAATRPSRLTHHVGAVDGSFLRHKAVGEKTTAATGRNSPSPRQRARVDFSRRPRANGRWEGAVRHAARPARPPTLSPGPDRLDPAPDFRRAAPGAGTAAARPPRPRGHGADRSCE
jgi:hypothetical protein